MMGRFADFRRRIAEAFFGKRQEPPVHVPAETNKYFASSNAGVVNIAPPPTTSIIKLPSWHEDCISGVCSAGPGHLLTCSEDKTLVLADWEHGHIKRQWVGHTRGINRLDYSVSQQMAFSGSRDCTVRAWKEGKSDPVMTFEGHTLTVSGVSASTDGQQMASGSRDYTVRLWDVNTGTCVRMSKVSQNVVTYVKWLRQEPMVLQASEDLEVRLWDTRHMSVAQSYHGHVNIPLCCDVSADGLYFVTCSNGFDGQGCEVRIWDRRKGKQLCILKGHSQSTNACVVLPEASVEADELIVASGSTDATVRLWLTREESCATVQQVGGESPAITSLAVLERPAGFGSCDVLCGASFGGKLKIWTVKGSRHGIRLAADTIRHS